MTGVHNLPMFIVAGLLLAMSPGPDTAYILGRSAQSGWRGGMVAAMGIAVGIWVHILAAAIGLSALLMTSARAFMVTKLVGACYLVFLGLKMIASTGQRRNLAMERTPSATPTNQIFWQGFLTNVLNPKVALFFLAFLPQFINSGTASKAASFLFLGLVFDVVGTSWNLTVAGTAARFARWARGSTRLTDWIDRTIGGVFIYLGFRLATVEHR
jgi:threonine/homoserine/homoserine lactone efflux protein